MKKSQLRKIIKEEISKILNEELASYDAVEVLIRTYEDENILNDFRQEFSHQPHISKDEFFEFNERYYGDMSELTYTQNNWEYLMNRTGEGVFAPDYDASLDRLRMQDRN